jgi:hypothetical protein
VQLLAEGIRRVAAGERAMAGPLDGDPDCPGVRGGVRGGGMGAILVLVMCS